MFIAKGTHFMTLGISFKTILYTAAATAACAVTAAVPAQAADSAFGLYGSLRAGASLLQDMNFADAATANLTLDPSAGWTINGAVGYRFTEALRVEFDWGYGQNNLKGRFQENVQVAVPCGEVANNPCLSPTVDGEVTSLTGFGMAYYDLPVQGPLKPYLGLGIGFVEADFDVGARASMNNGTVSRFAVMDNSDTVLGYRGTVGVAYDIGAADLSVGYSYTTTARMSVPGQGTFVPFAFNRRLTAHTWTAGVTYNF